MWPSLSRSSTCNLKKIGRTTQKDVVFGNNATGRLPANPYIKLQYIWHQFLSVTKGTCYRPLKIKQKKIFVFTPPSETECDPWQQRWMNRLHSVPSPSWGAGTSLRCPDPVFRPVRDQRWRPFRWPPTPPCDICSWQPVETEVAKVNGWVTFMV